MPYMNTNSLFRFAQKHSFILVLGGLFAVLALIVFGSINTISYPPFLPALLTPLFLIIAWMLWKRGKIDWLLYFYVLIHPLLLFRIPLFGPIGLHHLIILIVTAACILLIHQRKLRPIRFGKIFWPLILFLGVAYLSTVINIQRDFDVQRNTVFFFHALFLIVALNIFRSAKEAQRFFSVYIVSITFMVLTGIVAYIVARFTLHFHPEFFQYSPSEGLVRMASFALDANFLANHALFPIATLSIFLFAQKNYLTRLQTFYSWAILLLSSAVLFLTFSRSGMLAFFFVPIALLLFQKNYRRAKTYVYFLFYGVSLLALILLIEPDFLKNFFIRLPESLISEESKKTYGDALDLRIHKNTIEIDTSIATTKPTEKIESRDVSDDAINVRLFLWLAATEMFVDHPVFGLGTGNYATFFQDYLSDPNYRYLGQPSAHNTYLASMAENGIFGIFVLLLLITRVVWLLVWKYRFSSGKTQVFIYGISLALLTHVFQFAFMEGLNTMTLWYLFTFAALIEFLPNNLEKNVEQKP